MGRTSLRIDLRHAPDATTSNPAPSGRPDDRHYGWRPPVNSRDMSWIVLEIMERRRADWFEEVGASPTSDSGGLLQKYDARLAMQYIRSM